MSAMYSSLSTLPNPAIEEKIKGAAALPQTEHATCFDDAHTLILKLQKYLSDSTRFLPAYDIRHCQEVR